MIVNLLSPLVKLMRFSLNARFPIGERVLGFICVIVGFTWQARWENEI